jgi:hypothetical protein
LFQLQGIAKIGPIYYLISLWTTNTPVYQRTSGRPVALATAKAILPASVFAIVIPSILMFLPFGNLEVWQNIIAFWQITPLLVSPLTSLFATVIEFFQPEDNDPGQLSELHNNDVPYLVSAYSFAFFLAAAIHVAVLLFIAGSPALSFARIFWDLPSPFGSLSLDGPEAVFSFLKYDLAIYTAASSVWYLYSVFEMRRQGYVTTTHASTAAVAVVASTFLLGPGATYAGTWWWRESIIATLSQRSLGQDSY